MSNDSITRSVAHSTFTLERTYKAAPQRVFAAFADKKQKAKWFDVTAPEETVWEMDFREGGREYNSGPFEGHMHSFDSIYHDIIENERIVYSYTLSVDGQKLSASLTTLEFEPSGDGTKLTLTEYDAYFDGLEEVGPREEGTRGLLDAIAATLDE